MASTPGSGALLASAASLCSLPIELVLSIIADFAPADLNALARTNKGFHNTVNPVLYQQNVRKQGTSALTWACEHNSPSTLPHLHKQGADFNGADAPPGWFGSLPSRANPMHLAAKHGRIDILTWLLDNGGADIDALSLDFCCCRPVAWSLAAPTPKWTPLHTAVCHGHTDAAIFLLSRGASPIVSPHKQPYNKAAATTSRRCLVTDITVLHTAAAANDLVLIDQLLTARLCLPNAADSRGYTPLHYAARRAHADRAIWRLKQHTPPWLVNCPFPPSPFTTAFLTGAFGAARLLHDGVTSDPDALLHLTLSATAPRRSWDSTPKVWAAQREAFITHLLWYGADATAPAPGGKQQPPLHRVAAQPPSLTTPAVFAMLLARGADAEELDAEGNTPLYLLAGHLKGMGEQYPWRIPEAVYNSFAAKVEVLQRYGGKVLAPDGEEGELGMRMMARFMGAGENPPGGVLQPWRRRLLGEVLRRVKEAEADWWAGWVLERWARVVVDYGRQGKKFVEEKMGGDWMFLDGPVDEDDMEEEDPDGFVCLVRDVFHVLKLGRYWGQ